MSVPWEGGVLMMSQTPVILRVRRLTPEAILPTYATAGAACVDLHATSIHPSTTELWADTVTCGTGLAVQVPEGYAMLVFSRSGHGFRYDTRLANCVGVIDSDYRGEVKVKLTRDHRRGWGELIIRPGDRVAQAMLVAVPNLKLLEVDALDDTTRGTGGFGSTGQ